jgi:Uma2 family endonuclease
MTTFVPAADPAIFYPSSDGEPLAESYDHLYAILTILEVLRVYLIGQRATVLADQFLYYVENNPQRRVAPDVMVIFNVEPGGRDNYKIWAEGEVPQVVFEVTSPSTRSQDELQKKALYEELGVTEYWQFDPRGEWIDGQLRGYRLQNNDLDLVSPPEQRPSYVPITDNCSLPLNLRLTVENKLVVFYRLDNGDRLLLPGELVDALQATEVARQEAEIARQSAEAARQSAESVADRERQRADELAARLARYEKL